MKIANIMLGKKRGGIEQAAVDYAMALRSMGHEVISLIHRDAAILPVLAAARLPYRVVRGTYRWNPFIYGCLSRMLNGYDLIILHGNRASALTRYVRNLAPMAAVAHSRFFVPHPHFAAVIALAPARARLLATLVRCPIHIVPNMIDVPPAAPRPPRRSPPVIGIMGRFSPEKGIDLFIRALGLLKTQGVDFSAIIGGDGIEGDKLRILAIQQQVDDRIAWHGWVQDKPGFFAAIDLFVVSSYTETFPITLLEAMAHGVPAVATDCGGPGTILVPGAGILTAIDAAAIAEGIATALASPANIGEKGQQHVQALYAKPVVARILDQVATHIANAAHS